MENSLKPFFFLILPLKGNQYFSENLTKAIGMIDNFDAFTQVFLI